MKSIHNWLRERLLTKAGIPLIDEDYQTIRMSSWSYKFEKLMRNRLCMGALRYGKLNDPEKPPYDCYSAIKDRIELWKKDGNDEHLVDIANLCLVEFEEGFHPKKHFKSQDGTNKKVKQK